MYIDLTCIPIEAVLLAVDYFSAENSIDFQVRYEGNIVVLDFDTKDLETNFIENLNDFVKRLSIAEQTRKMKEIIIGRALYGLLEEN
jgi:His-Xaa-Ser system protein HxsD